MNLYNFQKSAVRSILNHFKKNKYVCLAYYTGSGKTHIICQLVEQILSKDPGAKIGISAYFTNEIRSQVIERLHEFGLGDCAVELGVDPFDKSNAIFVFNPQHYYFNEYKNFKYDYLILDEAHHGIDLSCRLVNDIIVNKLKKTGKGLLVTATPWDFLSQKRFSGMPVMKRPLDKGVEDGLITDFELILERAKIRFEPEDFTRVGDVSSNKILLKHSVIKSSCFGLMDNIVKTYKGKLGKKVVVICPPGNSGEIAREMAIRYSGLAFLEKTTAAGFNTSENLDVFKNDPHVRFLFVVRKCTVGFDMKELDTVIDFTMTRNVKTLVQRIGRIARKNGSQKKKYIYCYDESLTEHRRAWLFMTVADFSLGYYDGYTTKTAKYYGPRSFAALRFSNPAPSILKIIRELKKARNLETAHEYKYIDAKPPRQFTAALAQKLAKTYSSRHDMFKKDPSLYKWFRKNNMALLDKIHPRVNKPGYWTEKRVISCLKKSKSRADFNKRFSGAAYWLYKNNKQHLKDEYLPEHNSRAHWKDEENIKAALRKMKSFSEVRRHHSGLRHRMRKDGTRYKWQRWFKENVLDKGGADAIN